MFLLSFCSSIQEENSEEKLRWADAFIIVYSISDRCSFEEVMRLKFLCNRAKRNCCSHEPVILIIGNKTDMTYDRIVGRSEAETLARTLKCSFKELSVRESHDGARDAFMSLYGDYKDRKKSTASMSPKFLGKRRRGQSSDKIDLDSNPPKPRERSISFTGLSDLWNWNSLFPETEVITEEEYVKPKEATIG